ncbi:2,3-diaminopropionate biosynthesis protein SbnB [Paenibacillus sp. GCM10027628]|uniref:2,3-diaminopropionate biosynthesis protein SbnB n=1 Tax=Paenibacillus sp. GCM10027628 TaxID=3273413 RepID=UPI003642B527
MIYLHDDHIRQIGTDWRQLTDIIRDVVRIKDNGDCVYPLKPYLRFREPANRIIAMPAFVGGDIHLAGIKWIASFPGNGRLGLPRAHNTIILNHPATGEPVAFIHSGLLNGLRTAAVSGVMLDAYCAAKQPSELRLGIIGWGPIGRLHLDMCADLLGEKLKRVMIFDLKGIDLRTIPEGIRAITEIVDDWRSVYRAADVLVTCTVATERYIDEAPPVGSLLLNVSLRDYKPEAVAQVKAVIVDDWREVCRENTDIELLHLRYGLKESGVRTLSDVVCRDGLAEIAAEEPVYFNPMGLGIFDIAVAGFYWREAMRLGMGVELGSSR